MYKNVVIPERCVPPAPGSRSFNKSCKPHDMLDSRLTMWCPGMTKHGFTLIELLVVVLIISILSSVALPQYQKAVEKSRASQALMVLKSLAQAQEAYYLSNGAYADKFDQLDVELPWTGKERWRANDTTLKDTRSNEDWSLQLVQDGQSIIAGIYMGRLTGPYKGAGWVYYMKHRDGVSNTIYCAERLAYGDVLFTKGPGDYCARIFSAKKQNITVDQNLNVYQL